MNLFQKNDGILNPFPSEVAQGYVLIEPPNHLYKSL